MRRILITGGAGFVGRNMIRHIRAFFENIHITVMDNLSEDSTSFFEQGLEKMVDYFYRGSTENIALHLKTFDLCIHLAAVIKGKEYQESSPFAIARNLAIDAEVIKAVSKGLAKELIYFSSCAAYGEVYQNEINPKPNFENQLVVSNPYLCLYPPEGIYGWAKVMGETLCSQLVDTKVTVVRPFGGYGTDQTLNYPFPAILNRVQNDERVVVWGSGKQVRDWIHVKDICRLALLAHESHEKSLTINLGTGTGISFTELAIQMMVQSRKSEKIVMNSPDRPEGVKYRVADTMQMNGLGLFPYITVVEGIAMALRGQL